MVSDSFCEEIFEMERATICFLKLLLTCSSTTDMVVSGKGGQAIVQHLPKVDFRGGWNKISTHSSGRYGKHWCCRCQKFQKIPRRIESILVDDMASMLPKMIRRSKKTHTHFQSKIYFTRNPEYVLCHILAKLATMRSVSREMPNISGECWQNVGQGEWIGVAE